MAEDKLKVTHLMGEKLDEPIIIEWAKTENKNKMEQVAAMFGKQLGEEFAVKDKYKTEWHCKFTKRGLLYLDKTFFDWQESGDYLLQFLLIGKAVITNE